MSVWVRAGRVVSNAVNNGSGLCRLTVESTTDWTTGQSATVSGIGGATTCNGSGTITVINGTTVDFAASFSGSYDTTSDPRMNVQPVFITPIVYYSMGYQTWLGGQAPASAGGYFMNTGSDGQFYVYQATAGTTTGLPITAVANNGAGLCRLTVSSTAAWTTGQAATAAGGNLPAGCSGSHILTVVDATHIDLATTTFAGGYTTGAYVGVPPVHATIGASASDGGVTWRNAGFAKGRTYDLYQGQYASGAITSSGYNQGAATQVTGGTDNPIGNSCSVGAVWVQCVVTIPMPAPLYNNTGDYAWSATDPVRQLLPAVNYNGNFGFPSSGVVVASVDAIGPIGVQRIDYAQFQLERGTQATAFYPPPPPIERLTSIKFPDILGYLPDAQSPSQTTGLLTQTRYNSDGNVALFARRTIDSGVAGFSVANGDGVSGNPTLGLSGATVQLSPSLLVYNNAITSLTGVPSGTILTARNVDATSTRILADTAGTSVSSSFTGRLARGTIAAPTALQSGDTMVLMQAFGYGSTGYSATARGTFSCSTSQIWTDANQGTVCAVASTPNGSTTPANVMTWENSGGVTVPSTVTGGDKGAGTINSSGLHYVAGNAVGSSATSPVTLNTTTGAIGCATCGVTGTGLNQFASTTSAQLAGVISDETGSGSAVFGTAPTLTNATLATRLNKGVYIIGMSAVTGMSVTGTLVETTLATISVPANAMGANGALRITAQWSKTGTAGTGEPRIKFGGTTFVDGGAAGATVISGRTQVQIHNRNATNSQVAMAANQANFSFGNLTATVTSAIDTTSSQDVTFTCQLGNTGDTCTLESYSIELLEP